MNPLPQNSDAMRTVFRALGGRETLGGKAWWQKAGGLIFTAFYSYKFRKSDKNQPDPFFECEVIA